MVLAFIRKLALIKTLDPRLAHCVGDLKIVVHGITFIRHIKEPWNMELSSKLKKFYFFNCKTRTSTYDWPLEAGADFG